MRLHLYCCVVLSQLLYLLLQCVEILRGEELTQSDVKTVAEFLDCQDFRVCASSVQNVLDGRWGKGADGSKLIDRDVPLRTKLQDSILDSCNRVHMIAALSSVSISNAACKSRLSMLLFRLYIA